MAEPTTPAPGLRDPGAALLARYAIKQTVIRGRPVGFAIRNPDDVIQRHHADGRFYETPELEIIAGAFPAGGTFFDFGAHVGNHAIYAALMLDAGRVVVVEPNPLAHENLVANLILNGLQDRVDTTWLGYGVADQPGTGYEMRSWPRNLGAGHIVDPGEGNGDRSVTLVTGDTVVGETRADFIKLDVEGMELMALEGLAGTIRRDHPPIFVEVDDFNRDAFFAWIETNTYVIADRYRRYKVGENFLIVPRDGSAKGA